MMPFRFRTKLAVWCFLIPFVIDLIESATVNPKLLSGGLLNPDSAMRLVRLRDIIQSGSPLHVVARDGSGLGTVLHWSHALDSLLLMLAAPLAIFLGWTRAVDLVALGFGPICGGLLGLALGWTGAALARNVAVSTPVWLPGVVIGVASPVMAYGFAGVVHHHILLVVIAVVVSGWVLRSWQGQAGAGWASGVWAGSGLWISPECLPFILMGVGGLWLHWVLAPGRSWVAREPGYAGLSFFIVTIAAWWVDPPLNGHWVAEPDRLSWMFVWFAGAIAGCGLLPIAGVGRGPTMVAIAMSAVGWLIAFPQVLRETAGLMTAEQARAFFDIIAEMRPLTHWIDAVEFLSAAVVGLMFLLVAGVRQRSVPILYGAACALGSIVLGCIHVRFLAYPAAFGAAMLPIEIATVSSRGWSAPRRASARIGLLGVALLLPLVANLTTAATGGATEAVSDNAADAECTMEQAVALLSGHDHEVVLSPLNIVPELLRQTDVLTVGSLYHRNPAAFMRLRDAWDSVPGATLSPELIAAHVDLILVCRTASGLVPAGLGSGADTLFNRLSQSRPPSWLTEVGAAGAHGYALYKVQHGVTQTLP